MKNTQHENQQRTRNLSGCKIGVRFLDSAFVKKMLLYELFTGTKLLENTVTQPWRQYDLENKSNMSV